MTSARDSNDLPRIAGEAAWVRRLAVALARDVHAGEDIAQDALLAASRGHGIADLRAWLAGTVRNLARLRLRSDHRRATRELRGARPERSDDPALALERLELQEALLGAVRELPEPYRTTVLLRWFEGLEPEEIARRTQAPVRSVHTRLHRALRLLRESLERRSRGDRTRWLAAWLPALPNSSSGWKWSLLMNLKLKLAAAGLVALAALTIWNASRPGEDIDVPLESQAALARGSSEAAGPAREPVNSAEPEGQGRTSVLAADAPREAPAPAIARRRLHGTVIDVAGARLPGMQVVFRGEPAVSDERGDFEIAVDAERGELDVEALDWLSAFETAVELPDPIEGYFLVLARPRTVHGFVRDRAGEPVAGAGVSYGRKEEGRFDFFSRYRDPLRKRLGLGLEASVLRGWRTSSGADGSFELPLAAIPGLPIRASYHLHRSAEAELPEDDQPVTLVLLPDEESHPKLLRGRAVDRDGKPVNWASLRMGDAEARSNEHGEFALRIEDLAAGARLVAIHCDWEPVIQPCLSGSPADPGAWPDPLRIVFREPVAGIGGVVLDAEGHPVRDVEVLALDPPSWNEYLGRIGEAALADGDRSDVVLGNETVRTGEDGRFHIRGLAGRSYRLLARNKRTLELVSSEPIPAGMRDARIVVGDPARRCRFAGVIVDLRGQPLAGASLSAMRTLPDGARCDADGIQADEQGRFEMPGMSCELEGFLVWSETGPAEIVPVDRATARDALRLQVGRIARVRVQFQTPGLAADTLVFLDASGTALPCGTKIGRGGWAGGGDQVQIRDGESEVLIVSERAQTLVLRAQGQEVQRVALRLDPAQVNLVRP